MSSSPPIVVASAPAAAAAAPLSEVPDGGGEAAADGGVLGLQYQAMVDDIKDSSKTLSKKRKTLTSAGENLLKAMKDGHKRQCMVGNRIIVIKEKLKKPGLSKAFHVKAMEAFFNQEDDENLPAETRAEAAVVFIKACQKESSITKETLEVLDIPDAMEEDSEAARRAIVDSFDLAEHNNAGGGLEGANGSTIEALLSQ